MPFIYLIPGFIGLACRLATIQLLTEAYPESDCHRAPMGIGHLFGSEVEITKEHCEALGLVVYT